MYKLSPLVLCFVLARPPLHSPPDVDGVMGPESSARERLLPGRRGATDGALSDGSGTKTMRADDERKPKETAGENDQLQTPKLQPSATAGGLDITATTATDEGVAGEADVTVGSRVYLV